VDIDLDGVISMGGNFFLLANALFLLYEFFLFVTCFMFVS